MMAFLLYVECTGLRVRPGEDDLADRNEVTPDKASTKKVTIFDTTLRDGEQSPGCSMNGKEKVRMAYQLDRLGVDIIEAGFPIAPEGDFGPGRGVGAKVPRPIIAPLGRSWPGDIERAGPG